MLRFLLWLNCFILKVLSKLNKKLEQHLEYKKIKKMIKKKWDYIELILCKDGIVLLIKEQEQSENIVEWVHKNILKEPYERILLRKKENGKSKTKSQNEPTNNIDENSDQSCKVSNLRVVLPKTDNIINSQSQQIITNNSTNDTSDDTNGIAIKKEENKLYVSPNNIYTKNMSYKNPFRR